MSLSFKMFAQYQAWRSSFLDASSSPAYYRRDMRYARLIAETLAPELDLIDTRIVLPSKELVDICKKIRKTITKREHKLVDYDRHNNSLNKLREKKEKSLSDEKNLFKVSRLILAY